MELFELHLKHSDQLAAQRKQGNKSKKFAPRIFGTAIHSLVELGEVDLMLNFLRYEIPRRGYYLKNAFYNEAIHGLKRQGRFQEAVALFFEAHDVIIRQNQLISANHKSSKLRKAHVTMHTDGNVYTDIKLLTAALQCCSKGRLGREAVTILYSFQQMEDKKGLDTDTSDVMRLFEYGIIALATADHVDKLPSLLLSLEKMHRPLISSKRLLRVAYAAAISMNNQDVAANILSQFQKTYGPHAAISYKGIEGVKEIVMQDLEVGWTEAMADLHIQVELR